MNFINKKIDPDNCRTYYSCIGQGNADVNQCPDGYIYNTKTTLCTLSGARTFYPPAVTAGNCQKIVCPKDPFIFFPYTPNPAYYVLCTDTGKKLLFKCADEINQVFNPTTNECNYNCNAIGTFADRENCKNYYVCSRQAGKLVSVNMACGPNYYFDKNSNRCIMGTCTNEIS